MQNVIKTLCLFCITFLLIAGTVRVTFAEELWTQFRGSSGQGYAPNSVVPTEFSEAKNITWKTAIPGIGWSSPVIYGDQIWVTTAVSSEKTSSEISLQAIGMDLKSGRILHQIELFRLPFPEKIHDDNSYASPTPVVDQEAVYCHFGTFGTAAVSRKTGKILWKNDELKIEHQGGPGSSPVGHKNFLIVTCDGADFQYVAALEKKTGKIAWKRKRSAPFRENPITHRSFTTPLLWKHGTKELLISPGADQVHAYDPQTGKEYWHARYIGFSNVPAPVADEKQVYVCTGFFEPVLGAIRFGGTGDVTASHVTWVYKKSVTTVPSPILVKEKIYSVNEGGILVCLDCKTGKVQHKRRLAGKYSASPVLVNGLLYFCSEEGKIAIVKPNKKLDLAQVNRLQGHIKASPAIAGNALFIRTETHLYRIEEKQK